MAGTSIALLLFLWSIKENIFWQEEHRSNRPVKLAIISSRPYFWHCAYQEVRCYTFPRECSQRPSRRKERLCRQQPAHVLHDCPQNLREWKEGLGTSAEIFTSLPSVLAKNTTKIHHFITIDVSITILSCNSYNSQLPINPFASRSASCALPHADPERAQAVLLTHALLMITNLDIFSAPPPPKQKPWCEFFPF